jgi:hypothetical protein
LFSQLTHLVFEWVLSTTPVVFWTVKWCGSCLCPCCFEKSIQECLVFHHTLSTTANKTFVESARANSPTQAHHVYADTGGIWLECG